MLVPFCKSSNYILFLYSCEYRYGFHAVFIWIQCGLHIVFLWIQVWNSCEYRYGEFTGIQYRIHTVKTVYVYYNYLDSILFSCDCGYEFHTVFLCVVFLWIQIWIAYCIPVNTVWIPYCIPLNAGINTILYSSMWYSCAYRYGSHTVFLFIWVWILYCNPVSTVWIPYYIPVNTVWIPNCIPVNASINSILYSWVWYSCDYNFQFPTAFLWIQYKIHTWLRISFAERLQCELNWVQHYMGNMHNLEYTISQWK